MWVGGGEKCILREIVFSHLSKEWLQVVDPGQSKSQIAIKQENVCAANCGSNKPAGSETRPAELQMFPVSALQMASRVKPPPGVRTLGKSGKVVCFCLRQKKSISLVKWEGGKLFPALVDLDLREKSVSFTVFSALTYFQPITAL